MFMYYLVYGLYRLSVVIGVGPCTFDIASTGPLFFQETHIMPLFCSKFLKNLYFHFLFVQFLIGQHVLFQLLKLHYPSKF